MGLDEAAKKVKSLPATVTAAMQIKTLHHHKKHRHGDNAAAAGGGGEEEEHRSGARQGQAHAQQHDGGDEGGDGQSDPYLHGVRLPDGFDAGHQQGIPRSARRSGCRGQGIHCASKDDDFRGDDGVGLAQDDFRGARSTVLYHHHGEAGGSGNPRE